MTKFVHLHTHSHYSLLDGLTKIDELVKAVKADGGEALALTDHGSMYGIVEFYQKCKKAGIKPILGVETYLAPTSRHNKATKDDAKNYHLVLLAKNLQGYRNLLELVSIAHLEGFYYKPRIDWEVLSSHCEGLIASTACLGGEIPRLITSGNLGRARERILEYNKLFGQDNFYLELQDNPEIPEQQLVNNQLIAFSKELGIPLIATNDIHYLKKEDAEAQDILLCLQNKKKKSDTDRMSMMDVDCSAKSIAEMNDLFGHIPDVLENTVKIAEMCEVELELGKVQLPHFEVPEGFDGFSYMKHLTYEGIKKRYGVSYEEVDEEIRQRADYELEVIGKMGWPAYFLIVADFVNWAKSKSIVVGPGRGSAAGSLVCYLLGITNLDPLKYDLLFERFLNPDRISMPDIDMDFADIRRQEVLEYVASKYGQDHVAQIATFGTMAARAAIRDVGRVLDYPYDYCDKLSKMIPMFTSLDEALETVKEFKDIYEKDAEARTIVDYARRLEGVARHSSTHACGVLITKDPLTHNVPIQYASPTDKSIVSQYSLHPTEDLGLLKMDFLGLKNLTIIESAIKIIKNTRGLEIDIDNIPLDDPLAYKLFQDGETTGVFQFESSGMKRYLRELKPTEIEDIIAMVALYRPGPMEWIPEYIAGKHGRKEVQFLHPKLKNVLGKTYGVAIYQEQVMMISRELAGFSKGEADVLRKAMGKKIVSLLAEQKEKFIKGCINNGIAKELGEKVFSFIEPFAGYGFNRSHAACYALVAYQTAYLKAHWPTEFMAALLTADRDDTDRIAIEIEECRNMGIKVMQPDINESFGSFTVVTSGTSQGGFAGENEKVDTIRFGLKGVKGLGEHIVDVVIAERKKNGPYKDIFDLLERVVDKDMNKKSLEAMIKSGALDEFEDRGKLLANIEILLSFSRETSKEKLSGQNSLFAGLSVVNAPSRVKLNQTISITQKEKLAWEKELLGLYITEHPFSEYRKHLRDLAKPLSGLKAYLGSESITVAGVVTSIKKIQTKSNDTMLFVKIEDGLANTEILVFPKLLQLNRDIWEDGKVLIVSGKLSDKDQEVKLLADKAGELDSNNLTGSLHKFRESVGLAPRKQFFKKDNSSSYQTSAPPPRTAPEPLKIVAKRVLDTDFLGKLKEFLAKNSGDSRVYLKVANGEAPKIIELGYRVRKDENLLANIESNFKDYLEVV